MRFATKNFLEENSMQLFGVHFEAASMLDLITSKGIILHLREANSLIDTAQFEAAMGRISDAFNNLIREFQLNLMPNWALVCGADELSLYHFTRTFRQIGEKREFTIKPSFESCRFCYDLLVETAIRAEQTFAGKSRQIGSVFGYTQSRD